MAESFPPIKSSNSAGARRKLSAALYLRDRGAPDNEVCNAMLDDFCESLGRIENGLDRLYPAATPDERDWFICRLDRQYDDFKEGLRLRRP